MHYQSGKMKMESQTKKARFSLMGSAMALGLVLGGLVGILIDTMIIFSGGGMILGLAVGTALESRRMKA